MLITSSLHILCLGDSLTAGFYQGGAKYHPYTIALKTSLEKAYPSFNISIDNQGASGDQVTSPPGKFLPRIEKAYEEVHPQDPYNWAIILGGTNDVSSNRAPKDVYTALQKVWSVPLAHDTSVLALTIPECGWEPSPITVEGGKLNKFILKHTAENYYTFDLRKAVPWDMPDEKRNEIWDDLLHFKPKGYDLIGKLLAKRLVEIIDAESIDIETQNALGKLELKKRGFDSKEARVAEPEARSPRSGRVLTKALAAR